jgi:geranylgeranyl pyrophosphate synthase
MYDEISSLISKVENLKLGGKIIYVLQTQGKLLRPALLLLSGQSVGANKDALKKLTLAIELLHEATLVHDDILDNDTLRRNAEAVHVKWSIREAILVGDILASLSLNLASEYGEEISKIISQTCILLCDGEYMDVAMNIEEISEHDYFEKILKKSASLFKAATQCGAIAGGGSKLEHESLAEFGKNLGIAYQIRDHINDVTSLKDDLSLNPNDFQTLPLIYMKNKENQPSKTEKKAKQETTPKKLYKRLKETGSLNYSKDKMNQYLNTAIASLKPLKKSIYKSTLWNWRNRLGYLNGEINRFTKVYV